VKSSFSAEDLDRLLPHQRGMRLLDRILDHDEERTRCSLAVADSHLFFDAEGRVPSWVALEYMAQCSALRGGLCRARDAAPASAKAGVLAGCRRLELRCKAFDPRERLEVRARSAGQLGQALAFDCEVRREGSAEVLASARLQVSLLETDELFAGVRR